MGDAMMNRPLIARRKTVLRHRQRNSTRKQRCQKRDNLQGGHLHTLLTPALTQTRRRKHIVRLDVFDLDHRLVRIVVSWTKPCPTPRALAQPLAPDRGHRIDYFGVSPVTALGANAI